MKNTPKIIEARIKNTNSCDGKHRAHIKVTIYFGANNIPRRSNLLAQIIFIGR